MEFFSGEQRSKIDWFEIGLTFVLHSALQTNLVRFQSTQERGVNLISNNLEQKKRVTISIYREELTLCHKPKLRKNST